MSFALQLAYKGVIIALIIGICFGLMAAVGTVVSTIFNDIDVALDGSVSSALQTGRELANNFVNPIVFNACIGLWLTAFPLAVGYTFTLYVQKLMDM